MKDAHVTSSDHGISGALSGASLGLNMTLASFAALGLANSFEVILAAWWSFSKHKGLYFWSLNASAIGTIVYLVGSICKFYDQIPQVMISVALIVVGWIPMVTGQSLVLYSRLHLIITDPSRFRWVLWMIMFNAFTLHIPTSVLVFGSNTAVPGVYAVGYSIIEKIQVTIFFIQEIIISGLYIHHTRKLLKPSDFYQRSRVQRVMRHLIYVNVAVIIMDMGLLSTEYANQYEVQIFMKGAIYSIKLRLEFAILNQLVTTLQNKSNGYNLNSVNPKTVVGGAGQAGNNRRSLSAVENNQYSVYVGKTDSVPPNSAVTALDTGMIAATTEVSVHMSGSDADSTKTPITGNPTPFRHQPYSVPHKSTGSLSSDEIELTHTMRR